MSCELHRFDLLLGLDDTEVLTPPRLAHEFVTLRDQQRPVAIQISFSHTRPLIPGAEPHVREVQRVSFDSTEDNASVTAGALIEKPEFAEAWWDRKFADGMGSRPSEPGSSQREWTRKKRDAGEAGPHPKR